LHHMQNHSGFRIAVVGTGISGLSAAWLLSQRHEVTVYERSDRVGGHSHTVLVWVGAPTIPVDTGFIVYNRKTYPNLTALFALLGVPTEISDMSFAASLDDGAFEYSGTGLRGLFAQRRNLFRPRFWSMPADLIRFYREAKREVNGLKDEGMSLGEYLVTAGYGTAFRNDHILPMASAIWSSLPADILAYPAAAFVRFHDNHGLMQFRGRPVWETVAGGSRSYVERLTCSFEGSIRCDRAVVNVRRSADGTVITDSKGATDRYDHVILATHADQALAALADPTPRERELLGTFRYSRNLAAMHSDESFMPKRRAAWSSWNYMGSGNPARDGVCVTYWMNRLQKLATDTPLFVTLNPPRPPRAGTLLHSEVYEHPIFDTAAIAAQRRLWSLQGVQNTWFCGAYFGAGFHEDGLQAGLAVAEQLGGLRRPWNVANESGRIVVAAPTVVDSTAELLP